MDILYACCAGLDVHKETVVATVRRRQDHGQVQQQTRTYGTMTEHLLELADWLEAEGVTHLAMESTGVYWKPIWNLLEDRFEILLVNAQHIKHVPGRNTDVKDSAWIAQLLQCGRAPPCSPRRVWIFPVVRVYLSSYHGSVQWAVGQAGVGVCHRLLALLPPRRSCGLPGRASSGTRAEAIEYADAAVPRCSP